MIYTFSTLFWLQKIKNSDLRYVSCRVTVCGKSTEISTGIKVHPDHWDDALKHISLGAFAKAGERQRAKQDNRRLDELEENILHIEKDLRLRKAEVSAVVVKQLHKGEVSVKNEAGFLEMFDKWLAKIEQETETVEGKDPVTIQGYRNRRNNFAAFIASEFKKADLKLTEVPPDFQETAKIYFQKKHCVKQCRKFGLCPAQVNKHMACVDTVLEFARKKGLLGFNPTTKERIKTSLYPKKQKVYLDYDELLTLQMHEFTLDDLRRIGYGDEVKMPYILETTKIVADCFLFGCYTGLAFHEQSTISGQNVVLGFDGKKWLKLIRSKTEHHNPDHIFVPLLEVPQRILERYGSHPVCLFKDVLLPVPSNVEYNRAIKDVARILGIPKHLTTHVARKTFTTLFVNAVKNPKMAALIIGDTEEVMKNHYLAVQHETIAENMNEFEQKMKERQHQLLRRSG